MGPVLPKDGRVQALVVGTQDIEKEVYEIWCLSCPMRESVTSLLLLPPFRLRLIRDQVAAVIQKYVHNEQMCNMYEYVLRNELGGMGGGGRRHGLKCSRRRMCTDYPSNVERPAMMLAVVIN